MPDPKLVIPAGISVFGSFMERDAQTSAIDSGNQANQLAFDEANRIMADAMQKASQLLESGMAEQADQIIHGAKQSAMAVMEGTQMGVESIEKFFAIADQKLEPFRQIGLNAGYEMSSMLGIPNANGEIVPYDLDKLRATPGFQFVFDEGQKAVERSAMGTKLSGAQLKAQTQYGQNLADTYFQNQFNNLNTLYQTGYGAGTTQAGNAMKAGLGIGDMYQMQGTNLANIYGNTAQSLASIYGGNAAAQAGLVDSLATNQANLALGAGASRASLYKDRGTANADLWGDLAKIGGGIYDNWPTSSTPTTTAPTPKPVPTGVLDPYGDTPWGRPANG